PSGYRFSPYTYYHLPMSGPTVTQLPTVGGPSALNFYYVDKPPTGWMAGTVPLATVLNAAFESSLGDGTAYTGYQNFASQRITYPMYAGFGSYQFDIGMGAAPQIRVELVRSEPGVHGVGDPLR